MNIHVVHSDNFDFKKALFTTSKLRTKYTSSNISPHETDEFIKTKNLIQNCDVVIAEVSFPSTGLGIELGWADAFNKLIICVFKTGIKISDSLKAISETFIEYYNNENLIEQLSQALEKQDKRAEHKQ